MLLNQYDFVATSPLNGDACPRYMVAATTVDEAEILLRSRVTFPVEVTLKARQLHRQIELKRPTYVGTFSMRGVYH